MTDLYAHTITQINESIKNFESGETPAARAKDATSTDTVDNVGNCESADNAGNANAVKRATLTDTAKSVHFPLAKQVNINYGCSADDLNFKLDDGIYLAVFAEGAVTTSGTLCGLMVVNGNTKGSYCNIAGYDFDTGGAWIVYDPSLTSGGTYQFPIVIYYQLTEDSDDIAYFSRGTLYFYKIGTLREED